MAREQIGISVLHGQAENSTGGQFTGISGMQEQAGNAKRGKLIGISILNGPKVDITCTSILDWYINTFQYMLFFFTFTYN